MSAHRVDQVLHDAIAAGVLPETATRPAQENRPWPVVLLTALGAWLAAIPLLVVVWLLLGDLISKGPGFYLIGLLVLGAAIVVLCARDASLFVEQLAVPALLVGGGALACGLFRDLSMQAAAITLALLAGSLAWLLARNWLRVLLGACVALLVMMACLPHQDAVFSQSALPRFWMAWHAVFALWIVALWVQHTFLNTGRTARHAAALESLSMGWILATLAGLALWSGMTFLVGGSLGGGVVADVAHGFGPSMSPGFDRWLLSGVSVLLAVGAAVWMARSWPGLRQWWCVGVALVLIGLSWLLPSLGAVWLALAVCVSSGRRRVAVVAGVAAVWIIGSFYYQLHWTLADKALLLIGAGVALGALVWLVARRRGDMVRLASDSRQIQALRQQAGIVLCVLAVLMVVNTGIWQKEDLIAHGQPVYVELAPVDPRSLMQGDYMQLNFRMPPGVQDNPGQVLDRQRPRVVARRDARGITTVLRGDSGLPLGLDEFLIELTPKKGRWILVSDAWFFKEGEGERWGKAKYGEFRVSGDGRALLVGLRSADLAAL